MITIVITDNVRRAYCTADALPENWLSGLGNPK
jgi:hypothetical protein